jgi:hypothetical protein
LDTDPAASLSIRFQIIFPVASLQYQQERHDAHTFTRFNKGQTTYIDIIIKKNLKFKKKKKEKKRSSNKSIYIKLSNFKTKSRNKIKTKPKKIAEKLIT